MRLNGTIVYKIKYKSFADRKQINCGLVNALLLVTSKRAANGNRQIVDLGDSIINNLTTPDRARRIALFFRLFHYLITGPFGILNGVVSNRKITSVLGL